MSLNENSSKLFSSLQDHENKKVSFNSSLSGDKKTLTIGVSPEIKRQITIGKADTVPTTLSSSNRTMTVTQQVSKTNTPNHLPQNFGNKITSENKVSKNHCEPSSVIKTNKQPISNLSKINQGKSNKQTASVSSNLLRQNQATTSSPHVTDFLNSPEFLMMFMKEQPLLFQQQLEKQSDAMSFVENSRSKPTASLHSTSSSAKQQKDKFRFVITSQPENRQSTKRNLQTNQSDTKSLFMNSPDLVQSTTAKMSTSQSKVLGNQVKKSNSQTKSQNAHGKPQKSQNFTAINMSDQMRYKSYPTASIWDTSKSIQPAAALQSHTTIKSYHSPQTNKDIFVVPSTLSRTSPVPNRNTVNKSPQMSRMPAKNEASDYNFSMSNSMSNSYRSMPPIKHVTSPQMTPNSTLSTPEKSAKSPGSIRSILSNTYTEAASTRSVNSQMFSSPINFLSPNPLSSSNHVQHQSPIMSQNMTNPNGYNMLPSGLFLPPGYLTAPYPQVCIKL